MRISLGVGAIYMVRAMAIPALAAVTITKAVRTRSPSTAETHQDIDAGKSIQVDRPAKCGFYDDANGFSRVAGGDSNLVIDKNAKPHFVGGHGDITLPNGTN